MTNYEPFIGYEYFVDGDQTIQIDAIKPNMTILTDSLTGKVSAEYYADAEYKFFDSYQLQGARGNYDLAYGGSGWTNELFKPVHTMRVTSAYMMFRACACTRDLRDICAE
jgi:hypothetical protein